jgi:hypothetical protein
VAGRSLAHEPATGASCHQRCQCPNGFIDTTAACVVRFSPPPTNSAIFYACYSVCNPHLASQVVDARQHESLGCRPCMAPIPAARNSAQYVCASSNFNPLHSFSALPEYIIDCRAFRPCQRRMITRQCCHSMVCCPIPSKVRCPYPSQPQCSHHLAARCPSIQPRRPLHPTVQLQTSGAEQRVARGNARLGVNARCHSAHALDLGPV